ncbi:unnamed protein product [Sphagnum jensenii]|uniref:Inward rectifier potassium channel C-terminal domain-containing protein n=1 Tax=Sphagnum jensenii TaxID=128206 RepID=A0ABP1AZH3_9BRYO
MSSKMWKEKKEWIRPDDSEPPPRLKGKAALRSVKVQQEESMMSRVYNAYIYTLRLPLHLFFLIMLSSPVLLSVIFTGLYLLDLEGLYIPQDHETHAESLQHHHQIHKTSTSLSLWEVFYVLCGGEDRFKIFIFSLSLSTTFGGTRVEARSPYTLLLANLNTLMAQLIFVFLSGAVFHRLSQPSEPIRWSQVALITSDKFTEHSFKKLHPDEKPPKSFLLRLNLTNPTDMVLIDCKFQLVFRRFLTSPGQLSPYITTVPLKLMHAEVAYLRYALVVRHVIDDESPLYGLDIEAFKAQDASFTITVSGVERSSMQTVFSERLYAVADGDVLWDRQFEDQIHTDQYGRSVFYSNRLSHLKHLEVAGDVNTQDDASNNNHRKKPKVQ